MAKRKVNSALSWIIKEAKRLRRKYPHRYDNLANAWRDGYVAQASAIYASKHKGKSPVGHKKHKPHRRVSSVKTVSRSHTDKNRITANIQVGSVKKPFTIAVLKRKYPRDMMGWREKEVLLHGQKTKVRSIQPGVYSVKSSKGEFLFTFKHPHHKDFSVVG